MKEFDTIKDMIYDEIADISHAGKINKDIICELGELVDILKDIGSVEMFEDGIQFTEDGYSFMDGNDGYSQRRPYYYNNGNSYRNNGRSYNSGYGRMGRGGYSREDGKEHMVEKLERLMMETHDQNDRDAIQRLINQMENK